MKYVHTEVQSNSSSARAFSTRIFEMPLEAGETDTCDGGPSSGPGFPHIPFYSQNDSSSSMFYGPVDPVVIWTYSQMQAFLQETQEAAERSAQVAMERSLQLVTERTTQLAAE